MSFRIFQNLQCVFYSVYRCISSVLEFPIMLGYITRTSFIYWDLLELTLCIGLYPDGGRGTSFITALEDSTEWLPLDFLLLEELGRESACLLQNREVYGTWTFKTFLIYIYSLKNPGSMQPQTVNVFKLININMCNWYFTSIKLIQCIKNLQKISITADERNENETKCINNNKIQIIQKNYKIRINKSSIFFTCDFDDQHSNWVVCDATATEYLVWLFPCGLVDIQNCPENSASHCQSLENLADDTDVGQGQKHTAVAPFVRSGLLDYMAHVNYSTHVVLDNKVSYYSSLTIFS